ncbi:hypothetical protein, partial [Bowmanella dokdonensis]
EGFNARLVGEDNLEVATHNGAKQQVLKILLEQGDAEDIEVRQANMEEIYSHFMTQPSAHRSAP